MSNLNRFDALAALYSDDEGDAPAPAKKTTSAPAPAPAPKKRNDNKNARSRGGRDGGNRRNDRRSGDNRGRSRGGRDGGSRRNYDSKADGRDRRNRDRNHRGDDRRTRQPRNGPRDHRHGRDAKKGGHGGVGTLAEEAVAGEAEVRAEGTVATEGTEQVPAPEPEPEEVGLTMAEYQAKVLAEKRAKLASLTGGPKSVRNVERPEGVEAVKPKRDGGRDRGSRSDKRGSSTGSRKLKKGYVSADKFFGTKPREENSSDGYRGDRRGDRNGRGRGRGRDRDRDRDRDSRNNDRNGRGRGARPAAININDINAFPTLG